MSLKGLIHELLEVPTTRGEMMLIRVRRSWELKESDTTPEDIFRQRRRLLKAAAAVVLEPRCRCMRCRRVRR